MNVDESAKELREGNFTKKLVLRKSCECCNFAAENNTTRNSITNINI